MKTHHLELETMMIYINPVAAFGRVVQHDFTSTSGAAAQAAAEYNQPPLQAVTAALLAEDSFADVSFWIRGSDDWTLCDGVDPHCSGEAVDIWTHNGACISGQSPERVVFVRQSDLIKRGYKIPEKIGIW